MGAEMAEQFWLFFVQRKPHMLILNRTDLKGWGCTIIAWWVH